MNLSELPPEIIVKIFSELPLKSLQAFALTSKQFYQYFSSIEIQYRYWLEISQQQDRTNDIEAIYKRLNKVKALQQNFNDLNPQQQHVLVRDDRSARKVNLNVDQIPYVAQHRRTSLRVLRDGYFIVSPHSNYFELYKLPHSKGTTGDSPNDVDTPKCLFPSVIRLDLKPRTEILDFDLDVENDLICCGVKEYLPNSKMQLHFHFFSLTAALENKEAIQHPNASIPFTHELFQTVTDASIQIQLNGPHFAVQIFERDRKSLVSIWNWSQNMLLEAVHFSDTDFCESIAFLTSDVLAFAIVIKETGNPTIQIVKIDTSCKPSCAEKYALGFTGQIETYGLRFYDDFQLFDDSSDGPRYISFIFAEPVVSENMLQKSGEGSILSTQESGCVCIEIMTLVENFQHFQGSVFVVQKKKLLDNLTEKNTEDCQNYKKGRASGHEYKDWGNEGIRFFASENDSVYPMYSNRLIKVPKTNILEIIDFNSLLKLSKPKTLTKSNNSLSEGRLRRMNNYAESHLKTTIAFDSDGLDHGLHLGNDDMDLLGGLVEQVRNQVLNFEQRIPRIDNLFNNTPDENNDNFNRMMNVLRGRNENNEANINNNDEGESDNDENENIEDMIDVLNNQGYDDIYDEDNQEAIEEFSDVNEDEEDEDGEDEEYDEDEDEDDHEHDMMVVEEIDASDESDQEERELENSHNPHYLQTSNENNSIRQAIVRGGKQSIEVNNEQTLHVNSSTMNFNLPYRTVFGYSDLGIRGAMIDKENIILEVRNQIPKFKH